MRVDIQILGGVQREECVRAAVHHAGFRIGECGASQQIGEARTPAAATRRSDGAEPAEERQLLVTDATPPPCIAAPTIHLIQTPTERDSTLMGRTQDSDCGSLESGEQGDARWLFKVLFVSPADLYGRLIDAFSLIAFGIRIEQRKSLFYQAVTQYSHDGIICVDRDGIVTVFNPRASEVLGTPVEQALGRPLVSFNPTAGLTRVLQQREIELENVISVNGRRVAANRAPITVDGKIVGAISTFQDVTQLQKYEQMVRRKLSSSGFEAKITFKDIVAAAEPSCRTKELAYQCGKVDAPVIILGESGTGKEMFAQGMHNVSLRARGPFVAVNCAALPEALLESELFGYDEGAFTGANRGGKQGLFELAHGGTLFLDEIGELPLSFQGRLLRVLQQREVLRVGGKAMIPVDVRVIAATHKPLQELVRQGAFRADLFYRLHVLSLHVLPLRQRREDVIPLAQMFLRELSDKYHKSNIVLGDRALNMLLQYDWPGNVRELRNAIERAVVMVPEHGVISDAWIFDVWQEPSTLDAQETATLIRPKPADDAELARLYRETQSVSRCAARLGVHRTTVWRRLKRLQAQGSLHDPMHS